MPQCQGGRPVGTSPAMGETIAVGSGRGYLATPEKGAGPPLVVIDEPGRAEHGHDVCDRFAAEGFTALAPELRNGHTAGDLTAAIDVLKPHPAVRGQGVGVVGFATGAGLALWLRAPPPRDLLGRLPPPRAAPRGARAPGRAGPL